MLEAQQVALIKGMLKRGDRQSDIAAYFGVNSGRIAEINTGERAAEVLAAAEYELPEPGPYIVLPHRFKTALEHVLKQIRQWEENANGE